MSYNFYEKRLEEISFILRKYEKQMNPKQVKQLNKERNKILQNINDVEYTTLH